MSLNNIDEELIFDLLREKEQYLRLNDYISQKKIRNSIKKIIKQINRKLNNAMLEFFV